MGNFPDAGPDAVRLPPTLPPKRKSARPRWVRPLSFALALVLGAVALSAVLNREVDKRLATVPPASTQPSTTLAPPPPPPTTPVTSGQAYARVTRSSAPGVTTTSTTAVTPTEVSFQAETPSELIRELEKLPVRDEHVEGYRRAHFGFYKDVDHDNCDTREEVYVAEAMDLMMNTRNCNIQSGKWFSPFDGKSSTNRADLDVVHLVSLKETWESGAWEWTDPQRNAYLNDLAHPETLLVVTEASHTARKDEDPGQWVPSNDTYLCDYLKGWVYLKTLYKLSVDAGEREAIAAASLHC